MLRNPDFRLLWLAQSVSMMGSQITTIALPLAAVTMFAASPGQVGVLGALQWLPFLLIGLPASILVDRFDRVGTMIVSDLVRFLLLAVASIGLVKGLLGLVGLYVLLSIIGVFNVFHMLSSQAILPGLVAKDDLVAANGMINVSASTARVGGPFLGGLLVTLIGGAAALMFDVMSFLLSAALLQRLFRRRRGGSAPDRSPERGRHWLTEFREGMRTVTRNRHHVTLIITSSSSNFMSGVLFVSGVYVLYGTQTLGLRTAEFGIAFAVGASGAVIGSLMAKRITDRLGDSTALFCSFLGFGGGLLVVAAASGPTWLKLLVIAAGHAIAMFGFACVNVLVAALVQTITPQRLLGRVGGLNRFASWGILPFGALCGGAVAELAGMRAAVLLAGLGVISAGGWVLLRPITDGAAGTDLAPGELPPHANSHPD